MNNGGELGQELSILIVSQRKCKVSDQEESPTYKLKYILYIFSCIIFFLME